MTAPQTAAGGQRPDIGRDLLARAEAARRHWRLPAPRHAHLSDVEADAMKHVDRANTQVLRRIVAEHGWPGRTLVGEEAARAAWLIALHADDYEVQKALLRVLTEAVRQGEATQAQWAHFFDRCCVQEGRPQIYGTQHRYGPAGIEVLPIHEPDRLDARRAGVGLPPYAVSSQALHQHHTEPDTDLDAGDTETPAERGAA
ncbi:DUF6624 domain-containing protein [Streptomyces sp. x-80]|uniref:DUF6624 domain-containing protein n=1 Tax=Streptomyces sp. x-80 TaxID=2789282 RepID=UPI0039818756